MTNEQQQWALGAAAYLIEQVRATQEGAQLDPDTTTITWDAKLCQELVRAHDSVAAAIERLETTK